MLIGEPRKKLLDYGRESTVGAANAHRKVLNHQRIHRAPPNGHPRSGTPWFRPTGAVNSCTIGFFRSADG
jgi:hypothetical protein